MNWSQSQELLIKEQYGKVRNRDLAASVGRSVGAVKQKARKLGVDAGRRHTEAEERSVRELYSTHTAREIANHLYGSPARVNRVFKIVEKLGLAKWRFWADDVLDGVRLHHAAGLTDRLIAARMSGTFAEADDGRLQVRHIRLRLGLQAKRNGLAAQAARRQGFRSQQSSLGIDNPNDLRKRAHRRFASRYGLPDDLRPAQVRMVLALVDGPMMLPELKASIGARPESQLLHNERKTTYQADLVNRGLVARVPTGAGGSARGPRIRYLLTAACLDLLVVVPREHADAASEG